jgi:hypothetical protein
MTVSTEERETALERSGPDHPMPYKVLRNLIDPRVGHALTTAASNRMLQNPEERDHFRKARPVVSGAGTYEIYGLRYRPLIFFHWGLTSRIERETGLDLLPSFCYFRAYEKGACLSPHLDRPACEYSLSLTLATSDGLDWPLEITKEPVLERPETPMRPSTFADCDWETLSLAPGDGLLYAGCTYPHARGQPNPNAWSAHLFLFWVEKDGPHAARAFDGWQMKAEPRFPFGDDG